MKDVMDSPRQGKSELIGDWRDYFADTEWPLTSRGQLRSVVRQFQVGGFQPHLVPYFKSLGRDCVFVSDFVDGGNCLCSLLGHCFEALLYCLIIRLRLLVGMKDGSIP